MSSPLFTIDGLRKSFDGVEALAGVSCGVDEGEIVGLIGPNGAGKTTLFNVATGFLQPDGGRVLFRSGNLCGLPAYLIARRGVARTFQDLRLIRQLSVLENVLLAFPNQPGERLKNVFFRRKYCAAREDAIRDQAVDLLNRVGLAKKARHVADTLSYGQQKLLSLVCCMATGAELLLLDEPVAGVAPAMIEEIMTQIRSLPGEGKSVILIEHNLDVVMQLCDRVVFMDAGQKVSEGTPLEVRNDPRVIEAYID